jgi:hypothetical protein
MSRTKISESDRLYIKATRAWIRTQKSLISADAYHLNFLKRSIDMRRKLASLESVELRLKKAQLARTESELNKFIKSLKKR